MIGNHGSIVEWLIHGAVKTVIDTVGAMTILAMVVLGGSDTKWIWPAERYPETNRWIRSGRFIHWIFVGVAVAILATGAVVIGTSDTDNPWIAILVTMALAAAFALLGRGLLYVLANE